jgi:putative endonuclease
VASHEAVQVDPDIRWRGCGMTLVERWCARTHGTVHSSPVRTYYVYILASHSRRVYVGATSDLRKRLWQHKTGVHPGHSRQYHITKLVYFEQTTDVRAALAREKQLKRWPRERKVRLIESANLGWFDLYIG